MKIMRLPASVILLLIIALLTVAAIGKGRPSSPLSVSLVQLLANPERYDKKRVSVCGFYHAEFELRAIYLSRDDARYGIDENSIWIGARSENVDPSRINLTNDSFMRVEGRFSFDRRGGGHGNLFLGELNELTLAVELAGQAKPPADD